MQDSWSKVPAGTKKAVAPAAIGCAISRPLHLANSRGFQTEKRPADASATITKGKQPAIGRSLRAGRSPLTPRWCVIRDFLEFQEGPAAGISSSLAIDQYSPCIELTL